MGGRAILPAAGFQPASSSSPIVQLIPGIRTNVSGPLIDSNETGKIPVFADMFNIKRLVVQDYPDAGR